MLWVHHDGPLKGRQKSWDMALSDRGCRQMVTPAKRSIVRERQTEKLRHGSTRGWSSNGNTCKMKHCRIQAGVLDHAKCCQTAVVINALSQVCNYSTEKLLFICLLFLCTCCFLSCMSSLFSAIGFFLSFHFFFFFFPSLSLPFFSFFLFFFVWCWWWRWRRWGA